MTQGDQENKRGSWLSILLVTCVTLILTDRRAGTRRTLVTFTDGAFYLLGVKPGDYELAVDEHVLDALGADATPLPFTLVPTAQGVGRSDLELRLKPRF